MSDVRLECGDCLELARELETGSVQTIVTSPPYWGLRAYGTVSQVWANGQPLCETHEWSSRTVNTGRTDAGRDFTGGGGNILGSGNPGKQSAQTDTCARCGAWRGELGLEPTPELYVRHIVELFRELRRALRDDGTLWLNLGDSYSGTGGQGHQAGNLVATGFQQKSAAGRAGALSQFNPSRGVGVGSQPKPTTNTGLKNKDLVGIPWRVAFALQADGWYLRSDIIWHKPNPMPESVTDRPTKSHEYIFLLSKQATYYYDADAIKEPSTWIENRQSGMERNGMQYRNKVKGKYENSTYGGGGTSFKGHSGNYKADGTPISGDTRNKRSVWTVPTQSFSEAHFATFPPKLITPCILAGCPPNGTVLDPFMGSGTTALVCVSLGRNAIGFELNPEYHAMAQRRVSEAQLQMPMELK